MYVVAFCSMIPGTCQRLGIKIEGFKPPNICVITPKNEGCRFPWNLLSSVWSDCLTSPPNKRAGIFTEMPQPYPYSFQGSGYKNAIISG